MTTPPSWMPPSRARRSEFERWSQVPAGERAAAAGSVPRTCSKARMVELVSLIVREGGRTYARCSRRKCARRPTSAATTRCRRRSISAPQDAARPRRRAQRAAPARPRRVRLHQPVELPARHLHRPGRRRARRRQHGDRQAGRADAAHRTCARSRSCARPASRPTPRCCVVGDGETVGAPLVADPRIAGVAFTGSVETARLHQPGAGAARRPDRAADRRDRRRERDARRLLGASRAGGGRHGGLGLPERRPALLGAAHPLRRRRRRAAHAADLLAGALAELKVGDPREPDTDIGPIIDEPRAALRSPRTSRNCAAPPS